MPVADAAGTEGYRRLVHAEQQGLRLGIACRTAVVGLLLLWNSLAPVWSDASPPRLISVLGLMVFTFAGIAHLRVIGTRFDRWWLKYAVYGMDILAICAMFAVLPISRSDPVPQIVAFRAYGIYVLFPLVVLAALSLSWRLVLFCGVVAVIGWWFAFETVVAGMAHTLSWGDIPSNATRADYETIFLSIDFIGRGNRIEETVMLFAAAGILALAVYRARRVFFAQVAADLAREEEQHAKARIHELLGRYVPEEIANRLVADPAPLAPQVRNGAALILDIAGFTEFAEDRTPQQVITELDRFLSDASEIISVNRGVVITYLGDGLLATFNTPVSSDTPEQDAVASGHALIALGEASAFSVRVGIATGDIASGNVGSTKRQSFTVYGTAVNVAARLESKAKELGVAILIDAATQAALPDAQKLGSCGRATLRGLASAIDVYGR